MYSPCNLELWKILQGLQRYAPVQSGSLVSKGSVISVTRVTFKDVKDADRVRNTYLHYYEKKTFLGLNMFFIWSSKTD